MSNEPIQLTPSEAERYYEIGSNAWRETKDQFHPKIRRQITNETYFQAFLSAILTQFQLDTRASAPTPQIQWRALVNGKLPEALKYKSVLLYTRFEKGIAKSSDSPQGMSHFLLYEDIECLPIEPRALTQKEKEEQRFEQWFQRNFPNAGSSEYEAAKKTWFYKETMSIIAENFHPDRV